MISQTHARDNIVFLQPLVAVESSPCCPSGTTMPRVFGAAIFFQCVTKAVAKGQPRTPKGPRKLKGLTRHYEVLQGLMSLIRPYNAVSAFESPFERYL